MSQQKKDTETQADEPEAGGPQATKTQGVPDMTVMVNDGAEVGHNGVAYGPGDILTLEGPTAISLVQEGAVTIKETP